jgi:uncharacterized protein DUF4138
VNVVELSAMARQLSRLPEFLYKQARAERVRVQLSGIYLRDSLEWLTFRLANGSRIPFVPSYVRYYLVERKQVKRKAMQETALEPVFNGLPKRVDGRDVQQYAVGFLPFTVPKGKELVVEVAGADGGRTVELAVRRRVVLRAR